MLIPIPTGLKYTAKISGSVIKAVRCEHCGLDFVYLMDREVSGQGQSLLFLDNKGAAARAENEAHDKLNKTLKNESDLAPCPGCGWLQGSMVRQVKRKHLLITALVGFIGFVFLYFLYTMVGIDRSIPKWVGTLFGYGMLLWIISTLGVVVWIVRRNYNTNAPTRAGKKTPKIMRRDEFEQLMAQANDMQQPNTPVDTRQ